MATPVYAYGTRFYNASAHGPTDTGERDRGAAGANGGSIQKNKGGNVTKTVDCVCSNAPPPHNSPSSNGGGGTVSRNHSTIHYSSRHETFADLRNRHREKTVNRSRNEGTAMAGSGNHAAQACGRAAALNVEMIQDPLLEIANVGRDDGDGSIDDEEELVVDIDDANDIATTCNVVAIASNSSDMTSSAAQRHLHNWQATKSTIKERLSFMFNNELLADVHFIVGKTGNTRRIAAHKFVLSIGSAVFDAMFNGGMATNAAEIELPDVEPAAFLSLLWFFYADEVC